MHIRAEQAGDAAAIGAVVTAAFATAPHSSGTEEAIVAALRDAGALAISLVAEQDDGIVGHVAFSPVSIDGEQLGWFGLGPVAVRPERQCQGIGAALIRSGLEQLKTEGARGCVVLGDPGYYARFGFRSDPRLVYADVPAAYFQQLRFGGEPPAGAVAYHGAFDAG